MAEQIFNPAFFAILTVAVQILNIEGGTTTPALTSTVTVASSTSPVTYAGYVGCYLENRRRRDFPHNPGGISLTTLTPTRCMTVCGGLGYTYAAVGQGQFCFCSNVTPDPLRIQADDTKCSIPCSGDVTQNCGSSTHIRIFNALAPISLSLETTSSVVETGSTVTLNPAVTTAGPGYMLRLEYGDGSRTTEYRSNGAGLLNRTYHQAGTYTISALATDTTSQLEDVQTAIAVSIQSTPHGLFVNCPATLITYGNDRCDVHVNRGSKLQLDVSYTDGENGAAIFHTLSIGDCKEYTMGNSVQENLVLPDPDLSSLSSVSGKILHHGYPAVHPGHLFGIEYFAVATGSLDIYIYRPVCSEYCVAGHYCVTPGTCDPTCPSGTDTYSTDIQACFPMGPTPRAFIPMIFKLVYQKMVTIDTTGNGYIDISNELVDVLPGDIIAHDANGAGMLASISPYSGEHFHTDLYCANQQGAMAGVDGGLCTISGEVHQLKAVYGTGVDGVIPFIFTAPGNVSINFTVFNQETRISGSQTHHLNTIVMEGVNASIFDISGCIESTLLTEIRLEPFTGTPANVFWDFGDGTTNVGGVDEVSISHVYALPGSYNITANVSNAFSWKFNHTTVCVQERISGLYLSTPATAEVNVSQLTILTVALGTDYTCILTTTLSDGSIGTIYATEEDVLSGGGIHITFGIAGNVVIETVCTNAVSNNTNTKTLSAVERITGISLSPPGAMANTTFTILVTLITGSHFTVNLTYDGSIRDMTPFSNRTATSTLPQLETQTGPHTVLVTASNAINSVTATVIFVIEVGITNPVITCEFTNEIVITPALAYAVIPVDESVICNITMSDGTSVAMVIDWGDGSTNHTHNVAQGMPWSTNPAVIPIMHTYSSPKYCPLRITISNAFNEVTQDFPVMVMVGVEHVLLDPVGLLPFTPPASHNFSWTVTSGPVPIGVTCEMEWGDGFTETINDCDFTVPLRYNYWNSPGPIMLDYTVSNVINSKSGNIAFEIVTPIVGERCSSNPIAGVPEEPIDLVFMADRGPGIGILDLTFDCDITTPAVIGPNKRNSDSPFGQDSQPCTYDARGNYSASVIATSLMENKACFCTIEILNPVTDLFNVNTNAPIDYENNFECSITYTFNYYGPLPDDAWIEFNYGDGVVSDPVRFTPVLIHNYRYQTHGHYSTLVRLYNRASEVVKIIPSGCYADITSASMTVLREPTLPVGSLDLPGYGTNNDKFRTDEPLKVWLIMEGTFERYMVSVSGTNYSLNLNGTIKDVISLDITQYGPFTLEVQPVNPLYSGPLLTYSGEYMQPVLNVSIRDYGNETVAYIDRKFLVSMESYGTTMCIAVNDGINPNIQLYGDPSTCATATGEFNINPSYSSMNAPFHLIYQYTSEGSYTLSVNAWNIFSSETAEFNFVVSGIDCSAPNLNIVKRRRNFRFPQLFPRCARIKLIGQTDLECPDTLKNTKEWTMKRWDPLYNVAIEQVDITNIRSSINSALAFEPRYLPYGLYRLNYKVTMTTPSPSGERFFSQAETFIEVVKCDLIVQLFPNGIARKTVGPASILTLSPILNADDPDVVPALPDDFDYFEMSCIDVSAAETHQDLSVNIFPLNATDLPADHVDTGGCFKQGPGWLSPFSGSVTFNTSILKPSKIYELLVVGYKDTRSSNFTGRIEVLAKTPPEFTIDFKIPGILSSGSEGKLFNPNSNQLLVANITSVDCGGCNYLYEWSVYVKNYDYCAVDPDCMMILDPKHLTGLAKGLNSREIALYKSLFSNALYSTIKTFEIRLTITNDITSTSGSSTLKLLRNSPPYNGTCEITPSIGVAMQTNFTVQCEHFTDDDQEDPELEYKITCEADGRQTVICEGSDTLYEEVNLPIGDDRYGNFINCTATVTDENGASNTFPLSPVQVTGKADFAGELAAMDGSESDPSDMIEARADLGHTAAYSGSIGSQLKQLGRSDEIAFKDIGCAKSLQNTGLTDTRARPNAFKTGTTDVEKILQYEETRSKGANLVTKMMYTASLCTVESPAEARQMLNMIKVLCDPMEFLTRATQVKMIESIVKAVSIMKKHIDSLSVEEIEEMGKSIMTSTANINEAAKKSVESPTTNDIEDQYVTYDTNYDPEAKKLELYEDEEAQMRAARIEANKVDQTNVAETILSQCADILTDVELMMANVMVDSDIPTQLSSDSMETQVYKNKPSQLFNTQLTTSGGGKITIPTIDGLSDTTAIMKVSIKASSAIVKDSTSECPYSREVSLSFMKEDGQEIPVNNLAKPINVGIPQDPNRILDDDSSIPFIKPNCSEPGEYMCLHEFPVSNPSSAVQVRFRFNSGESTAENQLIVLVYKKEDRVVSSVLQVCMIPNHTNKAGTYGGVDEQDPYTCFIDTSLIGAHGSGSYRLGVRELFAPEHNLYENIASLPSAEYIQANWMNNTDFTFSYQLKTTELTCYSRSEGSSVRSSTGVKPLPTSSGAYIQCSSTHLTSFAGGWVVVPNTIDFDHVFSNADFLKNPTLYVTEIVIFVAYILAMVWARRRDKEDVTKLGLLPLLDNDPRDKYYYEVMVDTGMRRHAGTESKVYFILSGEEDETDVRMFTNTKRKILSRGSMDGFLMAVPSSLGALMYLRIWHDNSGQGKMKSWYLNHVMVRDVQTDKKYYFIANRWWAVEEDDGQVDRVVPVAGKEQMTEFSHLFAERATKNLSDGHLWFSVVARPPQSRFTRCQRVSCCLCLLYVSMLANAMFYELATSNSNAYQFGPFAISAEQIYIGIAVNLIVFPINFLIILLFRRSKPRKLRKSRVEAAIEASRSIPATSINDINPRVQSSMSKGGRVTPLSIDIARLEMSPTPRPMPPSSGKESNKKCMLPWGCTVFAWILLWLTILTAAVFVTFYGIMFGDSKCRKWITSMLISFLTSIFLTQPLKVLLFAIIFSVLIRKPGNDEEDECDEEERSRTIEDDEEYLHEDDDYRLVAPVRPVIKKPPPPNAKLLEAARKERLKEIQMWGIVREILFYTFYLTILLVISYRSVSDHSYRYKFSMEQVFITTNSTNHTFTKVKNVEDYWIWARAGMLRGLRAGPYYNNYPPFYLRGYINDKQSRIMGYATLRQVRVRPRTCTVPDLFNDFIKECNAPYEMDLEEKGNFGPNWTSAINATRDEYIYRDAESLNGYPYWGEMAMYSGGGYVVKLDAGYDTMVAQFEQLEQERWIDEYTRAVFLEFTVYNPSVNLFAISTILSEFRPSGGVFGSYRFEPCMLLPYMNDVLLFQIACEFIYLAFTTYFVVKELRNIYKQRWSYLKQFWNLIELSITVMSVTAVVMYFHRLVEVAKLTDYFNDTNGNGYTKFQYVGYWSEMFQYMIGFLVFLATIKFLKLLRFNKKICLLASTLKNSSSNLIHFSIIFNVVFLAFVQVFYLVYLSHLTTFKSFVRASEASVVMMMGKFDIYKMSEVNRLFTQIFLFLFVLTITFIVVNMFLSILNESFSSVRNDAKKQQNDYEIVEFILNRFKLWTGISKQKPKTMTPEELERERRGSGNDDPFAHLDSQIDRFLVSVSNIYASKSKFDDFLNAGMAGKMAQKLGSNNSAFPLQSHPSPARPGTIPLNNRSRGVSYDMAC